MGQGDGDPIPLGSGEGMQVTPGEERGGQGTGVGKMRVLEFPTVLFSASEAVLDRRAEDRRWGSGEGSLWESVIHMQNPAALKTYITVLNRDIHINTSFMHTHKARALRVLLYACQCEYECVCACVCAGTCYLKSEADFVVILQGSISEEVRGGQAGPGHGLVSNGSPNSFKLYLCKGDCAYTECAHACVVVCVRACVRQSLPAPESCLSPSRSLGEG